MAKTIASKRNSPAAAKKSVKVSRAPKTPKRASKSTGPKAKQSMGAASKSSVKRATRPQIATTRTKKTASRKPSEKPSPSSATQKIIATAPDIPTTAKKASPSRAAKTSAQKPAIRLSKKGKPSKHKDLGDLTAVLSQMDEESEDARAHSTAKFDIGVKHNGIALAEQELPAEYGKDRAVLLVVDPRFVFTYWEISGPSLQRALEQAGSDAKLTLRFYDIGEAGIADDSRSWDIEVFDRLGNWYLRLAHPEQHLGLDIGLKDAAGRFYQIVRSNNMRLPAQSLAKPGPIKWMVVSPSGDRLISDIEEYTDADMTLLKKILGPYFFDLLMRGRMASIAGSSVEAVFYDVQLFNVNLGETSAGGSPGGSPGSSPWSAAR